MTCLDSHVTVAKMPNQLESHNLAINNGDKAKKLRAAHAIWDQTNNIHTFFGWLDQIKEDLDNDYGAKCPDKLTLINAIEGIYTSRVFDKKELRRLGGKTLGGENMDLSTNLLWCSF